MTDAEMMLAAAVLNARAAVLNTQRAGMDARNARQLAMGEGAPYTDEDYARLIECSGLGENDIALLTRGALG